MNIKLINERTVEKQCNKDVYCQHILALYRMELHIQITFILCNNNNYENNNITSR